MTFCASKEINIQSENAVRLFVGNVANYILNASGVLASGDLQRQLDILTEQLISSAAPSGEQGTGLISQVLASDVTWNLLFPFIQSASAGEDVDIRIDRVPSQTEIGEQTVCYFISSTISGVDDFVLNEVQKGFAIEPDSPNPFPSVEQPFEIVPPPVFDEPVVPIVPVEALPPDIPIPQPPMSLPRRQPRRPPLRPPADSGFPPPRTQVPSQPPEGTTSPDEPSLPEDEDDVKPDEEAPPLSKEEEDKEGEILQKILEQLEETEQENTSRVREIIDALQEQVGGIATAISEQERNIENALREVIKSTEGNTRIILETIDLTLNDIGAVIGNGFDILNETFIRLEENAAAMVDRVLSDKQLAIQQDNTDAILSIAEKIALNTDAVNGGTEAAIAVAKENLEASIAEQQKSFDFVTEGLTIDKSKFLASICEMIEFYKSIIGQCPQDSKKGV